MSHETNNLEESALSESTQLSNGTRESSNFTTENHIESGMTDKELRENVLESESDNSQRSSSLDGSESRLNYRSSKNNFGKIQLTLEYSVPRQKLTVIVHKTE